MRFPRTARSTLLSTLYALLISLALASTALAKRKDDVVVMKNGDRFTGEIKGLSHGLLAFKSGYMVSSVQLDWAEVETMQSADEYIVTLTSGMRLAGKVLRESAKETGRAAIVLDVAPKKLTVTPNEVIQIQQLEASFWQQLTGNVDAGFSYATGTNPTSAYFSASATYLTNRNEISGATSSQFSTQTNAPNSFRYTLDTQYARIYQNKWYLFGQFNLLKSDQQDLDMRTTYGGGGGWKLVQTDRSAFLAYGGLVYSHETYFPSTGKDPYQNSAEGLLGVRYETFRFKTLDVSWNGSMYPSITDGGRVRFTTNGSVKIELVKDLYWNFQLYENYDTRPPVNAQKNDFGLTTSLGWKF